MISEMDMGLKLTLHLVMYKQKKEEVSDYGCWVIHILQVYTPNFFL